MILLTIFILSLVTVFPVAAQSVTTINFDNIPSQTYLNPNQYQSQGVTFVGNSNYVFYSQPPFYPSHSEPNQLGTYSNEIRVNFASPVSDVGFYYTAYLQPLIFTAYDSNGVQIEQKTGVQSYQDYNMPALTNSYMVINKPSISYITIDGYQNWYFMIDDLSFTSGSGSIPEFPSIALPVAAVLGLMVILGRRKNMV